MAKKISKELEGVISQMLRPLNNVPLSVVIEGISGYRVIPFNSRSKKDKKVLEVLTKVADEALENINKNGIERGRPNEVGNDIEKFVIDALNKNGYEAFVPTTINGHKKTMGYPDIEFIDEFNRNNYLECKTYNRNNITTTQRSFYLSPSKDFKITKDAHHFGISFEVYKSKSNLYKVNSWKILDLSKLNLNVKYEFNTDNRNLYNKNLILAEK